MVVGFLDDGGLETVVMCDCDVQYNPMMDGLGVVKFRIVSCQLLRLFCFILKSSVLIVLGNLETRCGVD